MHGRIALWIKRCTGACPAGLQYARGVYRMNCMVQRRLPNGLAGCTSACSAGLQYARGAYQMNCMVQRHLPNGLAGCTSACSAGLQGYSDVGVKPECSEAGMNLDYGEAGLNPDYGGVGVKPECSGVGVKPNAVERDSSSEVKRLRIPSGRESESVVVLAACSTCDPDITSKSLKMGPVLGGLDARPPGAPVSHAWAYRDFPTMP
ncbi:hypothetical protein CDL15_Pgr006029 [Punica granatum]|uniref:Uncharacterized protein n=1 Tax=Punica granatum TaxID=22663 RepID=A0A218VT93_PUNGR|nr:hypothetical protein CDL15_Pgr006029 [Punica granatum]